MNSRAGARNSQGRIAVRILSERTVCVPVALSLGCSMRSSSQFEPQK